MGAGGTDRPAVVAWLDEHAEVGDLAMTACADWVSWLIRRGTGGDVSHVAVVIGGRRLVEAYDKNSTLPDDDEGVYSITFEEFAGRGALRRVTLLRPTSVEFDQKELMHLARHVLHHSPTFASFSSVVQAALGLTATRQRSLLPGPLERWATAQLAVAGDGAERVHCAELATRLYTQSGAPPRFDRPRLATFIERVEHRPIAPLGGGSPRVARSVDPAETVRIIGAVVRWAALARWASRTARLRRRTDRTDTADLIHPVDFQRSPSFSHVATLDVES